jgi:DNA ligase (NAD+)
MSKNVNYLINNNKESTSAKNRSAKQFNIPILSEEEFVEKFLRT